jgi:hypothetical protein
MLVPIAFVACTSRPEATSEGEIQGIKVSVEGGLQTVADTALGANLCLIARL